MKKFIATETSRASRRENEQKKRFCENGESGKIDDVNNSEW